MTNIVSIDTDDREQVERLDAEWSKRMGWVPQVRRRELLGDALRAFGGPLPEEVWTPGDIVQHPQGYYTAQRHNDGWRTTSSTANGTWADDEQITRWVMRGALLVFRQQSMEATDG